MGGASKSLSRRHDRDRQHSRSPNNNRTHHHSRDSKYRDHESSKHGSSYHDKEDDLRHHHVSGTEKRSDSIRHNHLSRRGGSPAKDRERRRSVSRDRKRSLSRERTLSHSRERKRSRSRERRRSSSRKRKRSSSRGHSRQQRRRLSLSPHRPHHSRSAAEPAKRATHRDAAPRPPDFATLISGYAKLKPVEQLKARTKLMLERSTAQGQNLGLETSSDEPWTRFNFNKDALLEEEGAIPTEEFGAGLNMITFRPDAATHKADKHEQEQNDAHEAAIFGAPQMISEEQQAPAKDWSSRHSSQTGLVTWQDNTVLVAASVLDSQGLSWRERAAFKRKQRELYGG